ncbi:MAG TPA: hypothetical protein H9915_11405 [Candidatus Gemmiger faecigallinarum]|nr:hypothetical protein [Candidatus Gemmiger faecigallinarum]
MDPRQARRPCCAGAARFAAVLAILIGVSLLAAAFTGRLPASGQRRRQAAARYMVCRADGPSCAGCGRMPGQEIQHSANRPASPEAAAPPRPGLWGAVRRLCGNAASILQAYAVHLHSLAAGLADATERGAIP